jgi:hypothetical protein
MEMNENGWNFRKMGKISEGVGAIFKKGVSTSERCYIERLLRLPKVGTTEGWCILGMVVQLRKGECY